jgi:hypothetical protein
MPTSIHINDDVVYREIDGDVVAMSLATGDYVGLDAIGTHIWHLIERLGSLALVRESLMKEYDLDEHACQAELDTFVAMLQARGLVTIGAGGA